MTTIDYVLVYAFVPLGLYAMTLSILWARAAYASSQCSIAMDKGDMRVYHKWSQEASRRRSLAMRADVVFRGLDRYAYRKGQVK